MPANGEDIGEHGFSSTVGLLYFFNLIVGTGALALPAAFQTAGYVLGTLLLLVSAFFSYVSATFVIETISIANAATKIKSDDEEQDDRTTSEDELYARQDDAFQITNKFELSEMARLFFGKIGLTITYILLTLYLFGDLAIYSTTVPKSLMNVICESPTNVSRITGDLPCYTDSWTKMSRDAVYRICVIVFVLFCLPLVLAGMTKTKYVQLATTFSRWTAFGLMIVLASVQLIHDGPQGNPPAFNFKGFGSLFGVSVYAFMCHHSVPGLLAPVRNKSFINYKLISVYAVVFACYCTLSVTGSFAFHTVQDVYTLNFLHDDKNNFLYTIFDYFLALFPVFTLTSSYIIVAITLSNNLRVLVNLVSRSSAVRCVHLKESTFIFTPYSRTDSIESEALLNDDNPTELHAHETDTFVTYSTLFDYFSCYGIPILAICLPTIVSLSSDNVLMLASITGSYPGVGVQFIIPTTLIIGARRYAREKLRLKVPPSLSSPFSHPAWPFLILLWSVFTIVNVTLHFLHFG